MDSVKEYPTLTALMDGRDPGSVKVRRPEWAKDLWIRPGCDDPPPDYQASYPCWVGMGERGVQETVNDKGPWLIVSEDAPAIDTLRLEIAARVLDALHVMEELPSGMDDWTQRHAYALAEADALIAEARK